MGVSAGRLLWRPRFLFVWSVGRVGGSEVANGVVGKGKGMWLVGSLVVGEGGYEEGGIEKQATLVWVRIFWGRKGCGWWKKGAALGDAALVEVGAR